MTTIAKALGIFLLVGGLLLWLGYALPPLPVDLFTVDAYTPLAASPLSAAGQEITLEGVVIFSTRGGRPVPYIEYQQDGVRTKQLVFGNSRGCQPSAGDLPCAPGFAAPVPDLPYGARIRVRGTVLGDQILVEDYVRL